MITQNITTKIGVMTLMYFICYVLIKPVITGNLLEKNQIIILPLLFFLWLSSSFFISSLLDLRELDSLILQPSNSMFIYLTCIYVILILINLYLNYGYQSILILSGIYLALSLISIYL